jgi:hypothetical protein
MRTACPTTPFSPAAQETIAALWLEAPGALGHVIAARAEALLGRPVSKSTANKYKPHACRPRPILRTLSPSAREALLAVWAAHPDATYQWVADEAGRRSGRSIAWKTAKEYRAKAGLPGREHRPDAPLNEAEHWRVVARELIEPAPTLAATVARASARLGRKVIDSEAWGCRFEAGKLREVLARKKVEHRARLASRMGAFGEDILRIAAIVRRNRWHARYAPPGRRA